MECRSAARRGWRMERRQAEWGLGAPPCALFPEIQSGNPHRPERLVGVRSRAGGCVWQSMLLRFHLSTDRIMVHAALSARLCLLCVLLVPPGIHGSDLYVSPDGTPLGTGTMAQPYDLATALSGGVGQAGDTFWLSGGNYVIGHIHTTLDGARAHPTTSRRTSVESARLGD